MRTIANIKPVHLPEMKRARADKDPDTWIVCACDQVYFPMVKGLMLSLLDPGPLPDGIGLAFIDVGCSGSSLDWMGRHGVRVRELDSEIMGDLASPDLGYQRAQACRPFLPKLFPRAQTFIWIDSDTWVQDRSVFSFLREAVHENPQLLYIAPECHYSYTFVHEDVKGRREEMFSYYEPLFGSEIALQVSLLPTLNSGFFAMAASNPIWTSWQEEIRRIFLGNTTRCTTAVRHMADQIALNVVARRVNRLMLLDPLYNYICLWTPPVRDAQGIVRVALPPHVPLGIVHLAGGWKNFGEQYLRDGLFYKSGEYLTHEDRTMLEAPNRHVFDFR
jgi:lipopolysaccharide biosynthesis glycosyltransferase